MTTRHVFPKELLLPALASCLLATASAATPDIPVYADSLAAGWENWSWGTAVASSATAHAGSASAAVTYQEGWAGLYWHSPATIAGADVASVSFWIRGATVDGQTISLSLYDAANSPSSLAVTLAAPTTSWTRVTLPMSSFGSPQTISALVFQEFSGSGPFNTWLIDDVVLVGLTGTPTPTPTPVPGPALSIDASADRHAISPLIYGMNQCTEALAKELRLPVKRWGGNATTRYNWRLDVSNRGNDWYFENIPEETVDVTALPNGSASDHFVEENRRTGAASLLTVPLIGWTPKSRDITGAFSVTKYGAQKKVDPWRTDLGNGVRPDGSFVTGNDPADTSIAIGPDFVTDWMAHLKGRYGDAAGGGVRFYNLDNEPALWNSTHRDVHPAGASYDEMRDRTIAYAAAIKAADPKALTLGPAEWGWPGYFYSGLDAAAGGEWWNTRPDRRAHGDVPLVPWYLRQLKAYQDQHGVRLLDYLDLHIYPQAEGVSLSAAGSGLTQALRLRSTRCLWDPTYVDESWIDDTVRLIPRMKEWIAAEYPGTKLAISEYNWGAFEHINGAVAQADVLGIFGREGLDLATLWDEPTAAQPVTFAFRLYRNYDGNGGAFGDTSVRATSTDQGTLAIYSAIRSSDGALTAMVVNKGTTAQTTTVALQGFTPRPAAQVWRYSAANLTAIVREADATVSGGNIAATFPASSITLLVLPPAGGATPASGFIVY